MSAFNNEHRALGRTGLALPPVLFSAAAFGNVHRVITDHAKFALCGEMLRHVSPPVWVEVSYRDGDGMAIEVLGRMLRRLEIGSDEVALQLAIDLDPAAVNAGTSFTTQIANEWQKSCQLLGDEIRPKLVSLNVADDDAWRAVRELASAEGVRGSGLVVSDWHAAKDRIGTVDPDWIVLGGGCSVMRHPPELFEFLTELKQRQIPVVAANVFDGGFLTGGSRFDGRSVKSEDPGDRALLAWRKAFVALCDGHGISPAHACIQFALSLPGVFAVRLEPAYADRVPEYVDAVIQKVPENFWQSLQEEQLLADSDIHLWNAGG